MITMVRIKELKGFNPREFVVSPRWWGYQKGDWYKCQELYEEAKALADTIDDICIAVVTDSLGKFVLGEPCCKGTQNKFMLFNAEPVDRTNAQVRAVTFNTDRGALTFYLFDRWIRYKRGSVV